MCPIGFTIFQYRKSFQTLDQILSLPFQEAMETYDAICFQLDYEEQQYKVAERQRAKKRK